MGGVVVKIAAQILPLIEDLGSMYEDDLVSEFNSWYIKWKQQEQEHGKASLPATLSPNFISLPKYQSSVLILCTLPVTSCSAERSFSGLKRIKTPLRSTMGNERLSSLALLHVHRDIDINVEDIDVVEFNRRHPCRLQLANILS